jgi:hypothetical protein
MKRMKLVRRYQGPDYTIGSLYLDNVYLCDTIEDTVRNLGQGGVKVPDKTAIPFGKYKVELTMSPKFRRLLPILVDVPQFTGIRIHRGNTAADSSGCILPGENKAKGRVINSTRYEMKIVEWVFDAIVNGYQVEIEITN